MDMDPLLVRSTRLLYSKSKDSADQLRAVLEDLIKQRYGDSKSIAHLNIIKEAVPKKDSSSKHSSTSSSSGRKDDKDVDKKRHEKQVPVPDTIEVTKPAEIIRSKAILSPARQREPEAIVMLDDDDDDIDDDDDNLALEILEDDLSCIVCRGMSVGVCNQLVECLECHSLYHQECHQPPVAKADINDPRWAWYCATCTKTHKQPSKSSSSKPASTTSTIQASSHSTPKLEKKSSSDSGHGLFKRQESSKGSSGSSKTHVSPATSMGMAGLAASFQPSASTTQTASSKSSSASSGSSSKVTATKVVTNVISADKRLANMKKKAAAKQQEKRKHNK